MPRHFRRMPGGKIKRDGHSFNLSWYQLGYNELQWWDLRIARKYMRFLLKEAIVDSDAPMSGSNDIVHVSGDVPIDPGISNPSRVCSFGAEFTAHERELNGDGDRRDFRFVPVEMEYDPNLLELDERPEKVEGRYQPRRETIRAIEEAKLIASRSIG